MNRQTEVDKVAGVPSSWVCTDGRFINELSMLKRRGFVIIHLDMDVTEIGEHLRSKGMTREDVEKQLSHPSEREWQGVGKDLVFKSQFGNLPRLTYQIASSLSASDWDHERETELRREIEAFYAELYPAVYGVHS